MEKLLRALPTTSGTKPLDSLKTPQKELFFFSWTSGREWSTLLATIARYTAMLSTVLTLEEEAIWWLGTIAAQTEPVALPTFPEATTTMDQTSTSKARRVSKLLAEQWKGSTSRWRSTRCTEYYTDQQWFIKLIIILHIYYHCSYSLRHLFEVKLKRLKHNKMGILV